MKDRFGNILYPSYDDLRDYFLSYPQGDIDGVDFMIYIFSGGEFGWISNLPVMDIGKISHVRAQGTGIATFMQFVENSYDSNNDVTDLNYQDIFMRLLSYIGMASAVQLFKGHGVSDGWGGGFEIIAANENGFYKPDITWLLWTLNRGDDGIDVVLSDTLMLQYYIGNKLYYYLSVGEGGKNELHQINPLGPDNGCFDQRPSSFNTKVVVNVFGFHDEGFGCWVTFNNKTEERPVKISFEDTINDIKISNSHLFELMDRIEKDVGLVSSYSIWGQKFIMPSR